MSKALVLFSGGLDSTVALSLAIRDYGSQNVNALSVYYGQKHDREIEAAKNIAEYYEVEHITLDLSSIFQFGGSTLLKSNGGIACGTYGEQLKKTNIIETYVPFRNGLMISAAASIALAKSISVLIYGAHKDDSAVAYPDCSKEFYQAIRAAVESGSGQKLTLNAPFIEMQKKDIVKIGIGLNVPFELTWSCYNGEKKPCRVCATCIDRENAFKSNNFTDPLFMKTGNTYV